MIICSSSNIDLIQGVSGYGTVADGATDWRIENTPTGVFNILNSPNLLAPNVSIIDVGNVGIGTIPITGTNKLQVQGAASISGLITANTLTSSGLITANAGITVNTGSLTCANDTLSKTYTATNTTAGTNDILTMRYDTTNGIRFRQTLVAANDVRYDLIQKTNNVDYTAPVISFYKGNVGIGTNNPSTSYKLNVTGDVNISGGYFVGGSAFTIPYFNLTNKITAGNGISLSPGSASTSPSISTNLTAGNGISISAAASPTISTNLTAGNGISISAAASPTISTNLTAGTGISISNAASPTISANISAGSGITFTPSGNNISISASAGASSQWTGATGANIYYNSANVGIGTATIQSSYKLQVQGNTWVENQLVFNNSFRGGGGTDYACNKIVLYGGGNTPTSSGDIGLGVSSYQFDYFSTNNHVFYTGNTAGNVGTERVRINPSGNVGIGTNNPLSILHLHNNLIQQDVRIILSDSTTTSSYSRGFHLIKGSDNNGYLYNYENSAIIFGNNSIESMRIAANGNVGIGTSVCSTKLEVYNGQLKIGYRTPSTFDYGVRLLVIGGDSGNNIIASFKHPNDSQGLGIVYDGLIALGSGSDALGTGNQHIMLRPLGSGAVNVVGNLIATGTKSWRIKHPILDDKDLLHVCIESPRADNLYRGRKQLINGECEVNLDLECNTTGGMTDGTFVLINKYIQVFVNNNETFDKVVGSVVGNKLAIRSDNVNASCFIDWLVIGERNDNEIIKNLSTSSTGSVIVEIDRCEQQIQVNMPNTSNTSNNY
jgi:hypothetical protein